MTIRLNQNKVDKQLFLTDVSAVSINGNKYHNSIGQFQKKLENKVG